MTTPTPLPCPFCGEQSQLWPCQIGRLGGDEYWIECRKCMACGPTSSTDESNAVAAWNYAPRESPPDHLAARLRNARRRGRRVLARRRSR